MNLLNAQSTFLIIRDLTQIFNHIYRINGKKREEIIRKGITSNEIEMGTNALLLAVVLCIINVN